jgi:enediyne biosynthesis protein E4
VKRSIALLCVGIAAAQSPDFRNVAAVASLTRAIPNGGSASKQFVIETTGSGVAFIDYDNDGLPDIFIASGPGSPSRMYRNEGGGKFRETTEALGLTREGWAQGVCAGDFDNDGYTDLFVTYWGQNALYRNVGGHRFEDVTAKVHLTQDRVRYNTGCAFIDYDNDGKLDLFVANYLKFDFNSTPKPGANPYCFYRGIAVNCGPRGLPFDRNLLYHNEGGVFRDVSDESGISKPDGNYSLGVLTGDFNGDGLTDIYVASDQTASILYINQGNGKFVDEALMRGAALNDNGRAMSGMGVTAADYLHEDVLSIFRTNFSDELETLYRNRGKGEFEDVSIEAGMGQNTRFVGWGCGFFDFDNDGWPDLLLVNGHAFPEVDGLKIDINYRERAILYRNDHRNNRGRFVDISESAGPGILEKHSSRGLAFADFDNDGRVGALVNNQNETPSLLRDAATSGNHWIGLKLEGVKANRSAIGARVRVTAGSLVQMDEVRSGGSYLSQSDLRLHFGLGAQSKVDKIEITWPGGAKQVEKDLRSNQILTIRER